MALTPVTQDEFIKIASEEDVPLALAVALYGIESSFGANATAFMHPKDRASAPNSKQTDPNKFGYGSMQVIRSTFNDMMPGADYDKATDADLVRAGMRLIKQRGLDPDGSYNLQKVKKIYFGPGVDKAFGDGYSPSSDTKVGEKFNRYVSNVLNNYMPGDDLETVAVGKGVGSVSELTTSLSDNRGIKVSDSSTSSQPSTSSPYAGITIPKFDAAAAEKRRQEVQDATFKDLVDIQQAQNAAQLKILEAFKMNPYGTMSAMQSTADALTKAQGRLQQTVEALNFESPVANQGILGILELAGKNLGAKLVYDNQVQQVNALTKAAADFNTVLSGAQAAVTKAVPTVEQEISMRQEARSAGQAAIGLDSKAMQFELAGIKMEMAAIKSAEEQKATNRRLSLQERVQQFKEQAKAEEMEFKNFVVDQTNQRFYDRLAEDVRRTDIVFARNEAYIKDVESRIAAREQLTELELNKFTETKRMNDARLREIFARTMKLENPARMSAIKAFGEVDIEKYNEALTRMIRENGEPTAEPFQFTSFQEMMAIVNKNKFMKENLPAYLTGKEGPAVYSMDENIQMAMAQATDPGVKKWLSSVSSEYSTARVKYLEDYAARYSKGKSKGSPKSWNQVAPMLPEKVAEQVMRTADKVAAASFAGKVTPDSNFSANIANAQNYKVYMQAAGGAKGSQLVLALEAAEEKLDNVNSDAAFVASIAHAIGTGKFPKTREEAIQMMAAHYQEFARLRATDPVIKRAGIPLQPNNYTISTSGGSTYNLANRAEAQAYFELVEKQSQPSSFGKTLKSLFGG